MKKYKNLLIALAAIASIYLVRATGLDGGLIDNVLSSAIEAITTEDAPVAPVAPVAPMPAEGN